MEVTIDFSKVSEKKRLYEYLKELKGVHTFTLTRMTRRENWNRYYWGVIVKMGSMFSGYTPKEMHQEYARLYNCYFHRDLVRGKVSFEVWSTAKLYQDEFERYCFFCQYHNATFFGFYTPDIFEAVQV